MDGMAQFRPGIRVSCHQTLKAPIGGVGTGVHTGAKVSVRLSPAPAGAGIVFRRTDLGVDIPARADRVADTRLCTLIADPANPAARVGTIEHVMAALSGAGIDNAVVEVLRPVRVSQGDAWAELAPLSRDDADALYLTMTIDFASPAIGRQSRSL